MDDSDDDVCLERFSLDLDLDDMPDQNSRGQMLSRKTTRVALPSPAKSPTKNGRVSHLGLTVPIRPALSRAPLHLKSKPFDPTDDYNYDSTDDEDDKSKKVVPDSSPEPDKGAVTFEKVCKQYGKVPGHGVMRQFGRRRISLEGQNMGHKELKAFFIALVQCYINREDDPDEEEGVRDLTQLELTGNRMGVREARYLTQFAAAYNPLTIVNLSGCHLCPKGLRLLANYTKINKSIRTLDLSDNNIGDRKTSIVADIIENGEKITELILSRNRIGDSAALIGDALANNESITHLDLSWNHIRGPGAIGFCKGLKGNQTIQTLILGWNGFGFEGSVGMKAVLQENLTLHTLDLSNNRIHPPALFELIQGLENNKTIASLKLGYNPITSNMTSILLTRIQQAKESNLKELDLAGIIVDKEFDELMKQIQETRLFIVRYDLSLPLTKGVVSKVDPKNIFNIDPVRILQFMKEHLRTIDLFLKVDKDGSNTLTKDEMKYAFEMEGLPISEMALSQVMSYLGRNKDGDVELILLLRCKLQCDIRVIDEIIATEEWREFVNGERRMKRELIKEHEEQLLATRDEDNDKPTPHQNLSQAFTSSNKPRKLPALNGPKMG